MSEDQIKSLAETLEAERDRHIGGYQGPRRYVAQLLDKAASALTDLEAENARLRDRLAEALKALEPFSDMAGEMFARGWNASDVAIALDSPDGPHRVTAGDFFAARRVLEGGKSDG